MDYFEYYKKALSKESFCRLEESLGSPFRKSIRVNTLKTSVEDFKKFAKEREWELDPVLWCKEGFFIDRKDRENALGKDVLHHMGYFYTQEASSMIPVETLSPIKDDDIIIDLAAAPGSKFTQVAAKTHKNSIVIANEPGSTRLKGLVSNIRRTGIQNSLVLKNDPHMIAKLFPNTFSKVLLDAPCSGDGMIRRDKKALSAWSYNKVKFQSGIQKRLIEEAFKMLRPGGELIYSTCTMTSEEDEEVLDYLLSKYSSATMEIIKATPFEKNKEDYLKILPYQYDTEGFFVSKIVKKEQTEEILHINQERISKSQYLPKEKLKTMTEFLKNYFDYDLVIDDRFIIIERESDVWLYPKMGYSFSSLKIRFAGVRLGKFRDRKFIPDYFYIMNITKDSENNVLDVNEDDMKKYLAGFDLSLKVDDLYKVLRCKGVVFGFGKKQDTRFKNLMPKNIIIK